jgi:TolB-like protein/tetratricopeptide (TPR) repeat protein
MPSLIPGFEYDIFISYRHNDNKSGWVTEFVKNLQEELSATIKESVSVYFDSNPHDGLLETHSVDKSLEGKLKCLIFIPVLSQTYCDTKSFAWKHEFIAFNRIAKQDQYGRDVKLVNGNVSSRILPVKINDLDPEDRLILEEETGCVLRSIEFIFRAPGVKRPLLPNEDNPSSNLNKTFYRDQINKVGNGIKEILTTLSQPAANYVKQDLNTSSIKKSWARSSGKRVWAGLISLILLFAIVYSIAQFTSPWKDEGAAIEKSIAVLPFADMSPAKDHEYFSDGLSEELLNLLAKVPGLKVIARTSTFSFKGKNEDIRQIAKTLGVAHILEGSVRKDGDRIRVTAQLIRADDGVHLWSETYDRQMEGIFKLQDEIAGAVVSQLKITLLAPRSVAVALNEEVYNLNLQGRYFFSKPGGDRLANFTTALNYFSQALAIDSLDAAAWAGVAEVSSWQVIYGYTSPNTGFENARIAAQKSLQLNDNLAAAHYVNGFVKSGHDWDWDAAEIEFNKVLSIEPAHIQALLRLANLARNNGRYEDAIQLTSRAITLNPLDYTCYFQHAVSLLWANRLDDALVCAKKVLELVPEFSSIHFLLGRIYLLQKKNELALSEMQQSQIYQVNNSYGLALAYHAMGRKEEAEEQMNFFISNYGKPYFYVAQLYAYRNESDKAFEWLEKAFAEKDPELSYVLYGNPFLKNIEKDPRYAAFLRKMNLPFN